MTMDQLEQGKRIEKEMRLLDCIIETYSTKLKTIRLNGHDFTFLKQEILNFLESEMDKREKQLENI